MKKVISITLALIMALSLSVTAFSAEITAQTPSKDSNGVYQIGTAEELYGFAQLVNGGETSANAVLTANIVVNENVLNDSGALNSGDFVSWTPIGDSSNKYAGTFDGQGHTISGLYYSNSNTNHVGLFAYIDDGGKISNVGVVDSYIYGNYYIGGVCGYNFGTVSACYNTGTVRGRYDQIGGVCGSNYRGTVFDCYNTGTVIGSYYVGGVCGLSYGGKITDCYNTGTINGSSVYVGGVCGYNDSKGTITDCYNTGEVSGADDYVGGVCGYDSSGTITACYNTGIVKGTGEYVGGVCGYNSGTSSKITACYNTGEITGTGKYVGGVCGYNYNGTITGCYNSGAVSGSSNYVGGVCGYNTGTNATITGCYTNSGEVCGGGTGTVTEDCAIYSDNEFANGTVLTLLNTALNNASSDVVFYQVVDIDPYPVLTDNSKRNTNVEYTVAETYTVTIPSAVTLGSQAEISASDVVLKKGRQVNVALTGTSGESNAFTLKNAEEATISYTVKNGASDVKAGDTVLTVDPSAGSGSTTLNFAPAESAKFSGSYSGTVTFSISVN